MREKLVIFTFSFPYGIGELWKFNEINFLAKKFREISIIPYQQVEGPFKLGLAKNITVNQPLFPVGTTPLKMVFQGVFNTSPMIFFLNDFFHKKVYLHRAWFKSWLWQTLSVRTLLSQLRIKELQKNADASTVFYFYWGAGAVYLAPFLRNGHSATVVRFHGGDLYEERWAGYLPFRREILKNVDEVLFVSENGKKYLSNKYPDIDYSSTVARLGVFRKGFSHKSEDGVLRLVSCSFLLPLKRVHLIVEALSMIPFPVVWTHLGDGPEFQRIKDLAARLPSHVQTFFPGFVKSDEILNYYVGNMVDLFLNVSETEGVPVSVMEALSADVPVFATDVGGTAELVNDSLGNLLPADIDPKGIADSLQAFYSLPELSKDIYRKNARLMFEQKCNAEQLYFDLANILVNI